MEWKEYNGKKIFIKLKDGGCYNGVVVDVDVTSAAPLIWITIIDKFEKQLSFVHS